MVKFARKLTNTPSDMHRSDADALRRAGLSDRAILDLCVLAFCTVSQGRPWHAQANSISGTVGCTELHTDALNGVPLCTRSVQVIGYYGYVNRLVAGLGVPFGDSSATLVEGAPGL